MRLSSAMPRRGLGVLTAGAMVATLGVAVTNQADAAGRCKSVVTAMNMLSKQRFAGDSLFRRYHAAIDYPGASGWVDQAGNAILTVYPATASPVLLNSQIGDRLETGKQVKAQQPQALGAINGDFFLYPNIRGKDVEIPRGPMIKDGRIIRADRQRLRVVGVDTTGKPFGGLMSVRGKVQVGTGPAIKVAGVNWHTLQGSGVTVFSNSWSGLAASPRPAGIVEWVINDNNRIREVRTSTQNTAKLGSPVVPGTRVIAFPENFALVGSAGAVGQKVKVVLHQSTSTGVQLTTAVGRGVPLVENGVAAPLGCAAYSHSKAARPRTVIGWTKTGAWRTLTIPGTHFDGVGLRLGGLGLSNEAALAKKLGLAFAYELDGGGSTTLYTRNASGTWARRDLFGVTGGSYERPVTNGVAFATPVP